MMIKDDGVYKLWFPTDEENTRYGHDSIRGYVLHIDNNYLIIDDEEGSGKYIVLINESIREGLENENVKEGDCILIMLFNYFNRGLQNIQIFNFKYIY